MSGGKTTVENFENRQTNVGSDDAKVGLGCVRV